MADPRYSTRAATPAERVWLAQRLQLATTPAFRAVVAVDASGRVRAAVGYDRWTANAVEVHLALESPAAGRALLEAAFAYPFVEAAKGVMYAWVRASNRRSVALVQRLGFRWTTVLHDGATVGEDLLLFQMRREDCRWLEQQRKAA